MFWQQKGDYLGVKVDRYTKSKKVGVVTVLSLLSHCNTGSNDECLLLPVLLLK